MSKTRLLRRSLLCCALAGSLLLPLVAPGVDASAAGQRRGRRRSQPAKICFDTAAPCRTSVQFQPYDLPFSIPQNAVIWESETFYAVILKSIRVGADDLDCERFIAEEERLEAQKLFPKRKVFTSRCAEPGSLYYTNVEPLARFMAVYAGATKAEAERTLAAVRATGRFPGANIRRMRAGFNGT